MSLSLGIDIGTSGVRAAVIDADHTCLAMARATHLPQDPARIDADLWWRAVRTCLSHLAADLADIGLSPGDVRHITVDGTSGTMVWTDSALRPVSRALMYDSQGFKVEAARIRQVAPEVHITQGQGSALARALRIFGEAQGAAHLLHQADFIAARLTGIGGQSDVMNALKTGVDPETGQWPGWIEALFPPGALPVAHPLGASLGRLSNADLIALGYPVNAVVCAGTTDSVAAFLAAAPLEVGTAVTSLGSTLAIKILCRSRVDDPATGLYSHKVGDVWLAGGASNTGGRVLAAYFSPDQLAELSQSIDPSMESPLDYYPLLEPGERFPVNDPKLAPRLTPRPDSEAEFLHGLFEGIARIEADCYRAVKRCGGGVPKRLLSAGGAAGNATFSAIRARVLGIKPHMPAQTEAAIGAAKVPFLT